MGFHAPTVLSLESSPHYALGGSIRVMLPGIEPCDLVGSGRVGSGRVGSVITGPRQQSSLVSGPVGTHGRTWLHLVCVQRYS
jgi:hypothetical protein